MSILKVEWSLVTVSSPWIWTWCQYTLLANIFPCAITGLFLFLFLFQEVPDKIVLASSHLFLSITTTVRPSFLITLPCTQRLFNDVSDGSLSGLQSEVSIKVGGRAGGRYSSITTTVRLSFLITLSCTQRLFNDVSDGSLSGLQSDFPCN